MKRPPPRQLNVTEKEILGFAPNRRGWLRGIPEAHAWRFVGIAQQLGIGVVTRRLPQA